MTRLYLASTSPRRRELLRATGLHFRLLRPEPDPASPRLSSDPARLAVSHACHKARSAKVPPRLSTGKLDTRLVIGADTIVVLGQRILGKPRNREEARQMLTRLSGRTHRVISGLAVHNPDTRHTRTAAETSSVTFHRLDPAQIERYLNSDEPYDKAGAYGIQGRAGAFVAGLQGSYLNVVGLPVARLLTILS